MSLLADLAKRLHYSFSDCWYSLPLNSYLLQQSTSWCTPARLRLCSSWSSISMSVYVLRSFSFSFLSAVKMRLLGEDPMREFRFALGLCLLAGLYQVIELHALIRYSSDSQVDPHYAEGQSLQKYPGAIASLEEVFPKQADLTVRVHLGSSSASLRSPRTQVFLFRTPPARLLTKGRLWRDRQWSSSECCRSAWKWAPPRRWGLWSFNSPLALRCLPQA